MLNKSIKPFLVGVPADQLDRIAGLIDQTLEDNNVLVEDILAGCVAPDVADDGIAAKRLEDTVIRDAARALLDLLAGGNKEMLTLKNLDILHDFAIQMATIRKTGTVNVLTKDEAEMKELLATTKARVEKEYAAGMAGSLFTMLQYQQKNALLPPDLANIPPAVRLAPLADHLIDYFQNGILPTAEAGTNKPIVVTITGGVHSGKTHISTLIQVALGAIGFKSVQVVNPEEAPEVRRQIAERLFGMRSEGEYDNLFAKPIYLVEATAPMPHK